METCYRSERGNRDSRSLCGRSAGTLLPAQLCQSWRCRLRQVSRGVVWPLGHCPLHPVSHSPSHTTRRLLIDTDRALANKNESSMRVYSTGDLPDVYEDTFMSVAKPEGRTFHPTLILVCTRLGIDKINQVYMESLTATLQMEQSIGIAGYVPHA